MMLPDNEIWCKLDPPGSSDQTVTFMMQVLSKLLPIVIKQLQSAHPQTRKKVCATPAATDCCSTGASADTTPVCRYSSS